MLKIKQLLQNHRIFTSLYLLSFDDDCLHDNFGKYQIEKNATFLKLVCSIINALCQLFFTDLRRVAFSFSFVNVSILMLSYKFT